MKKLMIAAFAIAFAAVAQAASVNWLVNGTVDTAGYTVYLMTSIAESYDTVAALASDSVASANIVQSGRAYTTGVTKAEGSAVTKDATYYFAIVKGADATEFTYVELAAFGGYVYDPENQESAPGTFNTITAANILAGTKGTIGEQGAAVPEPTSALMLLVGLAGLALKRKIA